VLSRDELVAAFDLERVTHAAAAFDQQKLDWLNGEWIRRLSLDDLVSRVDVDGDPAVVRAAVALAQERSVTLNDIVAAMQFLLVADDDLTIQPESWDKVVGTERVAEVFDAVITHVEQCEPWTVDAIDFRDAITALELKPRKVMPALYAAIEGSHTGLPLFDSIFLLGRERALRRLHGARSRL
jgi:glutamyl-tRNA synthetase